MFGNAAEREVIFDSSFLSFRLMGSWMPGKWASLTSQGVVSIPATRIGRLIILCQQQKGHLICGFSFCALIPRFLFSLVIWCHLVSSVQWDWAGVDVSKRAVRRLIKGEVPQEEHNQRRGVHPERKIHSLLLGGVLYNIWTSFHSMWVMSLMCWEGSRRRMAEGPLYWVFDVGDISPVTTFISITWSASLSGPQMEIPLPLYHHSDSQY